MIIPERVCCRSILILLCLLPMVFSGLPQRAHGKGMWSAVAKTSQDDIWYVDQTLAYSTHDVITSSRGVLKFVPGQASELSEQIRESLDLNGIVPGDFSYVTAFISVDCRKELLHFSRIAFFDSEDNAMWEQNFDETQYYLPTPGTSADVILGYLCLNRPGFLDTLKKKKPFLYLFP